jgi:hypothetical protein
MSFDWLSEFQNEMKKQPDYAEKTLTAYRLGMRAGGRIVGVRIRVGQNSCSAARALPPDAVYHPDDAPHLPLPACANRDECRCVYRPVMTYEVGEDTEGADADA